jgi:two-component system sensor histidine kinase HydH
VRNPLSVIFNALSCIRRVAPDSEGVLQRSIFAAQEEAERLRALVSEILSFARPPAPAPQLIPLSREVREAADAARQDPSLSETSSALRIDVPESLPPAHADAALLRRALVNTLLNAFQHARPNSEVWVRARSERGGLALRLEIENECDPLTDEVLARVFEPFFTTRPSGTGLGLALVRQSLRSMGGSAELCRTPRGVCVSLVLPAAGA